MLRTRVRVGIVAGLILSLVFAALLTGLSSFDLFVLSLSPRYGEAAPLVLRIPHNTGPVEPQAGEPYELRFEDRRIVVPRGTVLQPDNMKHRAAVLYENAHRPPPAAHLASLFALFFIICTILTSYFQRFGYSRVKLLRSQLGLFSLMLLAVGIGKALLVLTTLPVFWIPIAAVSLLTVAGFDRRTALLVDMAMCFMVAAFMQFDLLLLVVLVTRGLTGSLLFFNRKRPRQMISAGLLSGIAATVSYIALTVMFQKLDVVADVQQGLQSNVLACAGGGLLGGLLGYLLRTPASFALGYVSRDRLLEMTDIETPLLKRMADAAPGSWEHSRAMANLAEAAAAAIGADPLLTRVGAYYHDVGKSVQPEYFIENLSAGSPSPHADLSPEVSADAIHAHVVLGTKMLRDEGVPEPVVEFAYTHHGTQVMEFFWAKYQQIEHAEDEKPLGRSHFAYPGMKPMSKETAIIMLVDSIEAASRTVSPPTRDRFEEMIRRVVFSKLDAGQLDDSGLTLGDLRVMSERMTSTLINMAHGRIKYPWQQRDRGKHEAQRAAELMDAPAVRVPPSNGRRSKKKRGGAAPASGPPAAAPPAEEDPEAAAMSSRSGHPAAEPWPAEPDPAQAKSDPPRTPPPMPTSSPELVVTAEPSAPEARPSEPLIEVAGASGD